MQMPTFSTFKNLEIPPALQMKITMKKKNHVPFFQTTSDPAGFGFTTLNFLVVLCVSVKNKTNFVGFFVWKNIMNMHAMRNSTYKRCM